MTNITFKLIAAEDENSADMYEVYVKGDKCEFIEITVGDNGRYVLNELTFDANGKMTGEKNVGEFRSMKGESLTKAVQKILREKAKAANPPKERDNNPDMFSRRKLPTKALKALLVLDKICKRIDELVKGESDEKYLLTYTTTEAVKALEEGNGYGTGSKKAYLPKVYRHLIVQVARNLKDPVPAVQHFTNNKRFMKMLDEAWKIN